MKRLTILSLLALLPLGLAAQTKLSLDECIAAAQANNKAIAAADQQLSAAQFERKSMRANFFPSVSAVGMGLYSTADGSVSTPSGQLPVLGADGKPTGSVAYMPSLNFGYELGWIYSGGVKVEIPVFLGGKVRSGYRMARLGSELAAQNRRMTEQEVIIATSQAYAGVVRAREMQRVAVRYHELLTELMRQVESAHKNGLKPQNDVLKVQVKLNESELNLRRAENARRLAAMNLCHYTGFPLTEPIEVSDDLPQVGTTGNADLTQRPEYRMLDQKTELARQKMLLARSERLPQIGLIGNYGYLHGVQLNQQNLFGSWTFTAGLQVSVPIFRFGGTQNKVRAAKAGLEQARAEQQNGNEAMELEMTQAANNLDEAQLEIRLAESSVAAATENLRMSERQYAAGIETLSDYLEAQTLWQQASQTQVEARVGCYLRYLEYRKAAGMMD